MNVTKQEARNIMKQKRNLLSSDMITELTDSIISNIFTNVFDKDIADTSSDLLYNILLFAAYNKEPDTYSLFNALKLSLNNINIYFPKVSDDKRNMEFFKTDNINELRPGYMNIPEPEFNNEKVYYQSENDSLTCKNIIFLPGLAFDKMGHRVGYGGGFYDKYLQKHHNMIKIALCYDFQVIDNQYIETDEYDICVNYIVTDKRFIEIRKKF